MIAIPRLAVVFFIPLAMVATVAGSQPTATPVQKGARSQPKLPEPVEVSLERKKVLIVSGKETLVSAEVVKPGEILLDIATYTNRASGPVRELYAHLPVPPNTEFVVGSQQPANVKASLDGSNFFDLPIKRKVRQPNGVVTEVPVSASEYRFLRWYLDGLTVGQSIKVSARFMVANDRP